MPGIMPNIASSQLVRGPLMIGRAAETPATKRPSKTPNIPNTITIFQNIIILRCKKVYIALKHQRDYHKKCVLDIF